MSLPERQFDPACFGMLKRLLPVLIPHMAASGIVDPTGTFGASDRKARAFPSGEGDSFCYIYIYTLLTVAVGVIHQKQHPRMHNDGFSTQSLNRLNHKARTKLSYIGTLKGKK